MNDSELIESNCAIIYVKFGKYISESKLKREIMNLFGEDFKYDKDIHKEYLDLIYKVFIEKYHKSEHYI
jgi:hypothetical protein